ncbi:MAG: hypothetical protein ACTSXD_02010 [Candidatus Heimdallarchaeaceae archaeon]
MKLFTKKNCSKCDYLKPFIPKEVKVIDIDTEEGVKELSFLNLLPVADRVLPILVKENGLVIIGAISIKKEFLKVYKH